ncbi:MAG: hypothetical protein K6G88_10090 [Lachnospiraceae bacterium]|nr:hypothetical protein [Lachnospiraceae bacterium]
MSLISVLLLFVIISFIPIILAYFIIYKRRINKRLQEGSYNEPYNYENIDGGRKRKQMPDFHNVAIVGIIFIVMTSLTNISSRVENLYDAINNDYDESSDIDALGQKVDELRELVEENKSMISDIEVDYGALNTNDFTADVTVRVFLKNSFNDAKYYIKLGKDTTELKPNRDGVLEGKFAVNIFEYYLKMYIICERKNGETVTEKIDYNREGVYPLLTDEEEMLYEIYTPHLSSWDFDYSVLAGSKVKIDAECHIDDESYYLDENAYDIVSVKYYAEGDGERIDEKELKVNKSNKYKYEAYLEAKKFKKIICYFEVTDSRGMVYRLSIATINNKKKISVKNDEVLTIFGSTGKKLIKY